MKILRSEVLRVVMFAGVDPDSEGIRRARALGVPVSSEGIEAILREPEIQVVFDATSAHAHVRHARALAAAGKIAIDLTPAAVGPYVVPYVNLDEHLGQPNLNMVSCGGQAVIPIVAAVNKAAGASYAEAVITISSKSAGPGTRQNIDEFTKTTSRGMEVLGGARRGKAIIILNPAEPPILMRATIYVLVDHTRCHADRRRGSEGRGECESVCSRLPPQTSPTHRRQQGGHDAGGRGGGRSSSDVRGQSGYHDVGGCCRGRKNRPKNSPESGLTPMAKKHIRLVDTTLRDGSHSVSHSYTPEDVAHVAAGLDAAGVEVIEITHGDGLGGSSIQYGLAASTDLDRLRAAAACVRKAKIAVLLLPGIGTKDDLEAAIDCGARVARIATHVTEADISQQHIAFAKKSGMEVLCFLMMAHMVDAAKVLEQAQLMESYGADAVYVVDSAGAMLPNEVREKVSLLSRQIALWSRLSCAQQSRLGHW